MERATELSSRASRNHAMSAALFTVLFIASMTVSQRPLVGSSADVYVQLLATFYFAPAAVALSVAAISELNEWKHRELVQLLAMAVAIGPAVYVVMGAVLGLLL